ncbi:MAG: hypothetical protein HY701_04250 [Gemmatimonadetes bacterium]|nr:hypothetical protein [Gemmatimonadota bacterium]
MSLNRLASAVLAWAAQAGRLSYVGIALVGASTAAAAQEPLYTVLNPTGNAPAIERKAMAPRPATLDGKTVYLVDVTFNGGDLFLQQMQQWMAANMPKVNTVFRVKRGVYAADDPQLWKEIQAVNGLMIMAIGH